MLKMLGNARNAKIAEKQNQMLVNFFLTLGEETHPIIITSYRKEIANTAKIYIEE